MTVTQDTSSPGSRIRAIREDHGLSLDDVAYEVRHQFGRKITGERLRQYEFDLVKHRDPFLLAEVLSVLESRPTDVSPAFAKWMEERRDLLVKTCSRCTERGPGDDHDGASCRPLKERGTVGRRSRQPVALSLLLGCETPVPIDGHPRGLRMMCPEELARAA